jgi:hypothetical protein
MRAETPLPLDSVIASIAVPSFSVPGGFAMHVGGGGGACRSSGLPQSKRTDHVPFLA